MARRSCTKQKPTALQLSRMEELGYLGRRGLLNAQDQDDVRNLYRRFPQEYSERAGAGRARADLEVNPL